MSTIIDGNTFYTADTPVASPPPNLRRATAADLAEYIFKRYEVGEKLGRLQPCLYAPVQYPNDASRRFQNYFYALSEGHIHAASKQSIHVIVPEDIAYFSTDGNAVMLSMARPLDSVEVVLPLCLDIVRYLLEEKRIRLQPSNVVSFQDAEQAWFDYARAYHEHYGTNVMRYMCASLPRKSFFDRVLKL